MAERTDKRIQVKDFVGLKHLDQLSKSLQQLHDVGCERDRAGNRSLHREQCCLLSMLSLFSPLVKSLRGLLQATELKRIQKRSQ